jgi:hypothetical protein
MPTLHPRINITLEPVLTQLLKQLAKEEHTSLANLAKKLLLEALERREDIALSLLADKRDIKNTKRVKHDDAWK